MSSFLGAGPTVSEPVTETETICTSRSDNTVPMTACGTAEAEKYNESNGAYDKPRRTVNAL